jgi:cytochrome b6-f complex iron-sulfur subunit
MAKSKTNAPGTSRRSFLKYAWGVLAGLFTLELVWMAADIVRPRKSSASNKGAVVVAGPVDDFEPESVTAFPQGRFYLARLNSGGFLALARECTHLGCTVPWNQATGRFECPCHASSFDIRGDVLSAPAPRALDIYSVRIENGIVKVDTARRLKRSTFDRTQVTFA